MCQRHLLSCRWLCRLICQESSSKAEAGHFLRSLPLIRCLWSQGASEFTVLYTGNLTDKSRWKFCPVFVRQKATWWIERKTPVHADTWGFHKREAAGFIIPRSLPKAGKWLSIPFLTFSLLVPLQCYFYIRWLPRGMLLLGSEQHLTSRAKVSSTFLLHNFDCYKFTCPAAKLCNFKTSFIYKSQEALHQRQNIMGMWSNQTVCTQHVSFYRLAARTEHFLFLLKEKRYY